MGVKTPNPTPEAAKASPDSEIARRVREAGERARAEAEARHRQGKKPAALPKEIGGTGGPEPTRFGDWEKNGIVSDF